MQGNVANPFEHLLFRSSVNQPQCSGGTWLQLCSAFGPNRKNALRSCSELAAVEPGLTLYRTEIGLQQRIG